MPAEFAEPRQVPSYFKTINPFTFGAQPAIPPRRLNAYEKW
jgi:hypothetical protein